MTIKNIIEMATNDYIKIRLEWIEKNERNKFNMTEYEQKQADKQNKKWAREIKEAIEA